MNVFFYSVEWISRDAVMISSASRIFWMEFIKCQDAKESLLHPSSSMEMKAAREILLSGLN